MSMMVTDPNRQFTQLVAADGKPVAFSPQWVGRIMSISIQNLSTVDALVIDNAGRTFTVIAGNNRTVNMPADWIAVKSVSVGTSFIGVTIYADEQQATDTGGSVNITNAVITAAIEGSVTAIVSGTVAVSAINSSINAIVTGTVTSIISGTVNVSVQNSTLTTVISGTVNTQIQNLSLTVSDSIVETNTTVLTGILPRNIVAISVAPNARQDVTITAAIDAFALALDLFDGFLSIYFTASGRTIYQVRQFPFHASLANGITDKSAAVEHDYCASIPAGATLSILSEYANNTLTGTLKY